MMRFSDLLSNVIIMQFKDIVTLIWRYNLKRYVFVHTKRRSNRKVTKNIGYGIVTFKETE